MSSPTNLTTFLTHLHSLFPASSALQNPYALVAGIVFAAQNRPRDAAAAYTHSLSTVPADATRRFREALFKTAVLYGAPRMINALLEVVKVMPKEEVEEGGYRDKSLTIPELGRIGEEFFSETYGASAPATREMLAKIHPDFDYFMISLIYGPVYAYSGILGAAETSLMMISALVGCDVPLQTSWHEEGAMRHGVSREEVDAVRRIAEEVVKRVQAEKTVGL